MMNLGDGLLFELENGKPRLVLAKYGAESKSVNHQKSSKSSCQIIPKKKSLRIINSKQGLTQPETPEQDKRCKDKPSTSYVGQNTTHEPRKTKNKGWSESSSSMADRVLSEKKKKDSHIVARQIESLVCLTQEQFQQILSTINSTTANDPQTHTEPAASLEENCHTCTTAEELPPNGNNHIQRVAEVKKNIKPLSHKQQSGLFSKFGERERERDALEAQRTEWRRELDEQMAFKKKQIANIKSNDKSRDGRFKDTMHDSGTATGAVIESSNSKAQIQTHRQLPAAIRSAFILGEAAPMGDDFSAQRAEQQRQWLQELDQQIEEAKLRRQREKEINSQAEDIEQWAAHFDSLHRASTVALEHREPDISSCLSHRSVSGALSTAWEGISLFGGESLGRASVDTVQGNQQRTSYLRTMTALLDPAQIEEREHRRLKQLEHQRAIEAQVEERRRQKEKEDASRRARDEEEERRVEIERERLQQQFLKDTDRQRHREELQSHKTEELYMSIQKAQEEAFKDKHLQRIKDLAKKGHDVSRLLRSLKGDSVSQAFSGPDSPDTILISSEVQIQRVEPSTAPSPRKDTAVQTEVSHLLETDSVCDPGKVSPNAALTCIDASNTLSSKNSKSTVENLPERSYSIAPTEGEADPYELYTRTSKNRKQQPGNKPEWNTQRPSKAFIPASERYPEALKRHRQESRRNRQMELMTLVEKNTVSRTPQQDLLPPPVNNNHRLTAQRCKNLTQKQSETQLQETAFTAESRALSPIPAVKNRLQQPSQQSSRQMMDDMGRPPSSDYVPYVRTDEVYHMDPMAPLSRPSTHESQQRVNIVRSRQATPLVQHDPSHPKNTERQQAILKGLSELRQGLLLKQRELETSLNPILQTQPKKHFLPFRPV